MSEQILERTATNSGSSMPPMTDSTSGAAPKRNRTFMIVALAIVAGLVLGGMALFVMQPGSDDDAARSGSLGATQPELRPPPSRTPARTRRPSRTLQPSRRPRRRRCGSRAGIPSRRSWPSRHRPPPPSLPPAASAPDAASSSSSASSGAKGGTISALTISPLGNSVKLKLDGKKYTVDEGEQFAKSYRLYDIFNANCAGFLYGDQNAVVCEGDSVSIG